MNIDIPEFALVVLIGPSGSGKSTFARTHFKATEIVSSDQCRGLVSDDENNQAATNDAFDLVHFIMTKRLAGMKLTVVDATNVQPESRKALIDLARQLHCLPVAIVFNLPEKICLERNAQRPDRQFGPHVVHRQVSEMRRGLRSLQREGFRYAHELRTLDDVANVSITRTPLWNNRKTDHGPFDIIGDIHGCYDELVELLAKLGYVPDEAMRSEGDEVNNSSSPHPLISSSNAWHHPAGRRVIFLGDLVDRGPCVPDVLRLVMGMVEAGRALCVPGNHDIKLQRKLKGKDVQIRHGLAETLAQLETEPPEFKVQVAKFLDGLISHYVLDDGNLVVAHAGLKAELQGRGSGAVRDFCLYGETTGEIDEFGFPVRYNWAIEYRGKAMVVYGHTPVPDAEWLNHTINIDTGCVFGGQLTALRYPERELVSVPAQQTYAESVRTFLTQTPALSAQQEQDDVLELADVIGKRIISTRLQRNVIIRAEQATAALEVMSRFAANPKWLVYLPPTMSPSETSHEPGLLEHPAEALGYYRNEGIAQVICQEKHMGSRAVVVVCRDGDAARRRFGIANTDDNNIGIVYTRTGRRFFDEATMENALLDTMRRALTEAGFWEEFKTDWVVLDCELMPWSAKAQGLLRSQYAAAGAASNAAMREVMQTIRGTGPAAEPLHANFQEREHNVQQYVAAYQRYCWPVTGLSDLKLAPFHVLATEGAVHVDKNHTWHLDVIGKLVTAGQGVGAPLHLTRHLVVDTADPASMEEGIRWWFELTERGGEGMVVKPMDFTVKGQRGLLQPAVKCRGREYLRIIYGPEYTAPEHLARLRSRGLGAKRGLALREFALGIESLERFVRREPLRRVHECVFGVLALESEPVDPRL